ncbi:hypothetical protein ABET41_09705 [Metabacillus fastidiosus]|uniref:Uncharacterized protein n=1 Tax=Metabacillus fastidiosus TaxID=1458 RepID=A0ABU6NZN3_9BACI|nr:hypothetical protein [Metabacillus fastidiosus]MED4402582.1 hypothetical protein [Metabacillus fastidiosus]MED4461942.1 hypothetical protein [Metabacillus fastidiosus]
MEIKIVLLYGETLPPFKHIEKILNKYHQYYLSDKKKEGFSEDNYYDIWIDERYTGLKARNARYYTPTVPVKKEFLTKFLNIFRALKGNMCLCKQNHEHPIVEVSEIDYEGYCFYLDNETEKILFLEEYRNNEGERFSVGELNWYKQLPGDKRWIQIAASEDTEKAFF